MTHLIIPESVKTIGECAFNVCYNLNGIYFEAIVENVHENAFLNGNDKTLYVKASEVPASYSNLNRITNVVCGITGTENRDGVIYLLDSNGNEYILG